MVSLPPTYDVNVFNSAYENICLIADKTWAMNHNDMYRKLNQYLWVQNINWIEKYHENKTKRRVRDIIPDSLLAQYGNYEYDEDRESQYKFSDELSTIESTNSVSNKPESWILDNIEDYFSQLFSETWVHLSVISNEKDIARIDECYNKCCPMLYTIENSSELQLQMRISNDNVRCLWNSPDKTTDKGKSNSQPNYQFHELDDVLKNEQHEHPGVNTTFQHSASKAEFNESKFQEVKSLPSLSAEVPEFFPKISQDIHYEPVPFHQSYSSYSLNERNYNKLYQNGSPLPNFNTFFQNPTIPLVSPRIMTPLIRSPHQWIPRIAPPLHIQIPVCSLTPQIFTSIQSICPMITRPLPIRYDKITQPSQSQVPAPIPVYQRPPELYSDHKRRSQGVDFNNLILLTKNAIKVRRNQSKNPQKSSSLILESSQPNLKSEDDVLQWLNKGYPKKAKEFFTIDSLVNDLDELDIKMDETNKNIPFDPNLSDKNHQNINENEIENANNDKSSLNTDQINSN
ncbi:uncharacterized protein [Chelonus insularis]|uniref:uncharacterized protein n=1 Tax=Chelonus insularis TaxID=460826 RepID=UPI00158B048F|nr:uncharacterized protein LOC118072130 [Chelonus insularis]